jgi:glucose dehydrogenase
MNTDKNPQQRNSCSCFLLIRIHLRSSVANFASFRRLDRSTRQAGPSGGGIHCPFLHLTIDRQASVWNPCLNADITVNGQAVAAVAQPSKQGILYVFDRVTGKPVWPFEEKPAPQGDVPGEWYSPTQPIPSKPPAYARNGATVDDLINFTPALRDQAQTLIARYKIGPVFTPPVESEADGPLATLTLGTASGGRNWPGGSYDPETHTVYAYACNACVTPIGLVRAPKELSDMNYVAGTAGQEPR